MTKVTKMVVVVTLAFTCHTLQTFATSATSVYKNRLGPPVTKDKKTANVEKEKISNLVADGFTVLEKMVEEKKKANLAIKKAELRESMEYPAIDVYGENSWGSHVNPYAGLVSKPNIPESYDVDCNGFVCPLDGDVRVTSHYGYRRRYRRQHKGIDLALHYGDTIRAAFDGKVRIASYEGRGYGNYVVIRHDNGLETVYGHMSRRIAKENDIVRAGDPIGLGGSTGRSTGPHLHFETRFMGIDINPEHIINFQDASPLNDIYTFKRNGRSYNTSISYTSHGKYRKNTLQSKKQAPTVYRIRKGDSLSTIAKRHGTSISRLCKLNSMSSRALLRPGQSLRIR